MYLKHFELDQKPFENTTNPRFFWFNETFAEALAALEYGLQENKGFMLLTGSTGCGKTALIHAFVETVGPEVAVAVIPDADMEPVDFLNYLAMELGWRQSFPSKGEFLIFFKRHLRETILPAGGKVLIIIDEAQRSSNRLLTDIRLFDALGTDNGTAVTVLMSGQSNMIEILAHSDNAGLKSRLALDIRLEPLTDVDTGKYIRHRMDEAGAKTSIFTPDAVEAVFQFSGGKPLQMNNLCDRALLTAYTNEFHEIDADTIRECAVELGISLDMNSEVSDEATEWVEADGPPDKPEMDKTVKKRPIVLFFIALVGVALVILLQMSVFQQSDYEPADNQDQAFSTFESYQQRLEKSDSSDAKTF